MLVWVAVGAGVICALVAIRAGKNGVSRYGRRIPVTEMLALGWQGDRAMLLGGLAGWGMAASFAIALGLAVFA